MEFISSCRDVTTQFLDCFPNRECKTLNEFRTKLTHFQRLTGTMYVRCHSITAAVWKKKTKQLLPREIGYAMMFFRCAHHKARRDANLRGQLYKDYHCESYFRVVYRDKCLQIIRLDMHHSHDLSPSDWQKYPRNRKLSEEQAHVVLSILPSCSSFMAIHEYVQTNYGINLTREDVRSLRKRLSSLEHQSSVSKASQLTHSGTSSCSSLGVLPCSENKSSPGQSERSTVMDEEYRRKTAIKVTTDIFQSLIRLDSPRFDYYYLQLRQLLEEILQHCPPVRSLSTTSTANNLHSTVPTSSDPAPTVSSQDSMIPSSEALFLALATYKPILPKASPQSKAVPPPRHHPPLLRSSCIPVASTTTTNPKRRRKSPLPRHTDQLLGFERTAELT